MGLAEDRAALQQANAHLEEAIPLIVQVQDLLRQATDAAASAIQNYDQADLVEATGQIAMADESSGATAQAIAQAQQNLESFIQRMS